MVGQWSIPGGMLELGETLAEGVRRELAEETGLEVKVLELIEAFERIDPAFPRADTPSSTVRPQYHYVILDYLCEATGGELRPGSDVTDVAWAAPEELAQYSLTPTATRVFHKGFALASRPARSSRQHE